MISQDTTNTDLLDTNQKLLAIGMMLLEYFKFLKMVNGGVCWNMAFLVNYHNINDP